MTIGDVEVFRINELDVETLTMEDLLPEHDPAAFDRDRELLVPEHWDPENNTWRASIAVYVLRSAGQTVLIDTGVGNHKERPHFPPFTHLETDFLRHLEAVGIQPDDVDVVINTHLHVDHTGWNTQLQGRDWIPTFPKATYYLPRADVEFWDPRNGYEQRGGLANKNVFEDSVDPIIQADLAKIWDDDLLRVDENLTLVAANGHTPGSHIVEVESRGERALFVGDVAHCPLQIIDPKLDSCFDEDPIEARRTRTRAHVLSRAADTNALVFAAHFRGGQAAEVQRRGTGFKITGWTPYTTRDNAYGTQ
ncbi:MBL fold metallo-hydrolase [Mycolicibacterium chlorophenolicum]|nr:MBL fold metallo-hydrolase [Mycolicibacterium chlorophenolicum]